MTQVKDTINSCTGKHLAYEERIKIEGDKELGYSNRAITRILNQAQQTINNAVNQEQFVRSNNVKSIMIKCMNTINIAIQLKPIIKRIFAIVKTEADVLSG